MCMYFVLYMRVYVQYVCIMYVLDFHYRMYVYIVEYHVWQELCVYSGLHYRLQQLHALANVV